MSAGDKWSREETILAMGLYLQTPFGKMHSRNPSVIQIAKKIDKSGHAVAMKMANIANADPTLDRKGLKGGGKLEKEIMNQFFEDSESIINEISATAKKYTLGNMVDDENEMVPQPTDDSYAPAKVRRGQTFFRRMVLASYDATCAITGINAPELLVASHIIPWSQSEEMKIDPHNGICLNALHDRAFDRGFLTFDDDFCVMLSDKLAVKKHAFFSKYEGRSITLPDRFLPSLESIRYHRNRIFIA